MGPLGIDRTSEVPLCSAVKGCTRDHALCAANAVSWLSYQRIIAKILTGERPLTLTLKRKCSGAALRFSFRR